MTLSDALNASRTLRQAVNRSGKYNVMVVENDDEQFQLNRQAIWYMVNVMKDLTTRIYYEPVYEGHEGLVDIEQFLHSASHQPRTDDLNPAAWEAMR